MPDMLTRGSLCWREIMDLFSEKYSDAAITRQRRASNPENSAAFGLGFGDGVRERFRPAPFAAPALKILGA